MLSSSLGGGNGDVPSDGTDWLGLTELPLPVSEALAWAEDPGCGAVTMFVGTVRDHSEGRVDVRAIEYEAYAERVVPKLRDIAGAARRRWPMIGRLVLLHRVGRVQLGEASVLVVVSTPHRAEAFAACQYCIDTIKTAVPIWKKEEWTGGSDWAESAEPARPVGAAPDREGPSGQGGRADVPLAPPVAPGRA